MYYKVISQIEKEIIAYTEMLALLRTLPDLEIVWQQTYRGGEIILCQPYDLDMFHRNRVILENLGFVWNKDLSVSPSCGEILTEFTRGNLKIRFQIDPGYEKSTCKRSVIGHEPKPIYEITCLDA
jgi:hypothetical protein